MCIWASCAAEPQPSSAAWAGRKTLPDTGRARNRPESSTKENPEQILGSKARAAQLCTGSPFAGTPHRPGGPRGPSSEGTLRRVRARGGNLGGAEHAVGNNLGGEIFFLLASVKSLIYGLYSRPRFADNPPF